MWVHKDEDTRSMRLVFSNKQVAARKSTRGGNVSPTITCAGGICKIVRVRKSSE